jgi:hypothetical protein
MAAHRHTGGLRDAGRAVPDNVYLDTWFLALYVLGRIRH